MYLRLAQLAAVVTALVLLSLSTQAAVRYVDLNCTNATPPYTNWDTAAVTIQDAVDAAVAGDQIWVADGVYATGGRVVPPYSLTNRVVVDKAITLQSVNGPDLTVIRGYRVGPYGWGDSAVRCMYLASNAALIGFTLTNGATRSSGDVYCEQRGGGVWCESTNSTVSTCVLTGNSAYGGGGGASSATLLNCVLRSNLAYLGGGAISGLLSNCTLTGNSGNDGGGAYKCTLSNCRFTGNTAQRYGGGVYDGILTNCMLGTNRAFTSGGGASSATLNNCTLTGNRSGLAAGPGKADGGGASYCTMNYCLLAGNAAAYAFGGVGGGALYGSLNNCVLQGNRAAQGGGAYNAVMNNCIVSNNSADTGGGTYQCAVSNSILTMNSASFEAGCGYGGLFINCTVVSNNAVHDVGGVLIGTARNCILYDNSASTNANFFGGTLNYCCTAPIPTNGTGNFTNEPLFVDYAGGNLRLQSNSPCINTGTNFYAPVGTDLDGRPRIIGSRVDIGAYEYQGAGMSEFIGWLQHFGLPTDGSADYAHSDIDRMNNWQEWRCGTDPTNALSLLRLLTPGTNASGLTLTWESVMNRSYFLERGTNMSGQPPFSLLATNLAGKLGTTVYTDTNATGSRVFYYRVGVEE